MASAVAQGEPSASIRQNWVVSPVVDIVFIIAAPIFALIWAGTTLVSVGTVALFTIFGVFNVAHHFPTFIRIYGDHDLLRRFKWRLLLGPIIPFAFFMTLVACVIQAGLPIRSIVFLFIILNIWDPWHFLMQHYGFVRIYDRHNKAPHKLASRMDSLICWSWFIYIMVAAVDWFPEILYSFYNNHRFALMTLFDAGVYQFINQLALAAAIAATVVYAAYLVWCRRRGYYISYAKLLLLFTTFGIMCLTYIPNPVITTLIPEWSFELGFATLGMVHVTQYLAIVWTYNRGLVKREGCSRAGMFESSFARGGMIVACVYCAVCLLYGYFVSERGMHRVVAGALENSLVIPWITGLFMATAFTSTIMHYYYDGFIWKVRHKENRQHLGMEGTTDEKTVGHSWWRNAQPESAPRVLWRQAMYFALPMALLAASYGLVIAYPAGKPEDQLRVAYSLSDSGLVEQSKSQAELAIATIDERVAVERRMIRIRPRAIHYETIAELLYLKSLAKKDLISRADDAQTGRDYEQDLREAIHAHEQALDLPASTADITKRTEIKKRIESWRREFEASDQSPSQP